MVLGTHSIAANDLQTSLSIREIHILIRETEYKQDKYTECYDSDMGNKK